jgi:hypothetical protein
VWVGILLLAYEVRARRARRADGRASDSSIL